MEYETGSKVSELSIFHSTEGLSTCITCGQAEFQACTDQMVGGLVSRLDRPDVRSIRLQWAEAGIGFGFCCSDLV